MEQCTDCVVVSRENDTAKRLRRVALLFSGIIASGIIVDLIDRVAKCVSFFAADKFQQGGDLFGFDPGGGVAIRHPWAVDGGVDGGRYDDGGHYIFPLAVALSSSV